MNQWDKRLVKHDSFNRCNKILKAKDQYSDRIKMLKDKLKKLENIKEKYKFDLKIDGKITEENLLKIEHKARIQFYHRLQATAVKRIEKWWKICIIKRRLLESIKTMHKSACKIQKVWRGFILKKKLKKKKELRNQAAINVQKWIRGYLVRKKYCLSLRKFKMQKAFEYFSQKKEMLMIESANKIKRFWIIYKNLKQKIKKTQNFEKILITIEPEITVQVSNKEKLKKSLSNKGSGQKKSSLIVPDTSSYLYGRMRALTEANLILEPIKEIKGN